MTALANIESLRGDLRQGEPMARHTTWRVGGPADTYFEPADRADLSVFLAGLPAEEPLYWVGLGSNLLVRDAGIRGTVIATHSGLGRTEWREPTRLRVEAGVPCAKVARICARAALTGVEFLAGIPGTFGGALAMNAGAFGGQTWDRVEEVETVDRHGGLHTHAAQEFRVGYRHVEGPPGEWFVAATLCLERGDVEAAQQRIRELLDQRSRTQPTQLPSAGSVFRNPSGEHAARLIERCGLKGRCIGGACVSEKHANFIVNRGTASAADIEALIEEVAAQVKARQGVELSLEVRIVGERGGANG